MPTGLDATDRQLDRAAVAALLGVRPATVTSYLADPSREFPAPDGRVGRSPWWWESTIRAYQADAPQRLARRTGRPRKTAGITGA